MNDLRVTTKYPLLLVHGLFGLQRMAGRPMFEGIVGALENAGCRVHVPPQANASSNEEHGEQLLEQIERFMKRTGYLKANLIGHSQGALSCRYAAAHRPDQIASVTSVSGPNHGCEIIDLLGQAMIPGQLREPQAEQLLAQFHHFLTLLDAQADPAAALAHGLKNLSSDCVAKFNQRYPQALPAEWGGEGAERVDGVHYYSWSGGITDSHAGEELHRSDPLHVALRRFAHVFERERTSNDGLVGRYSSHLGRVIRSDYSMDHLDAINRAGIQVCGEVDPVRLYVQHAVLLHSKGL